MLAQDVDEFATLYERNGVPPLWKRSPGFASLTHIILEQQVSLASALAAFERLGHRLDGSITPSGFLTLSGEELRRIGFSRQKSGYVRELAVALEAGNLDLDRVAAMSDNSASQALTALRGVGPWTAGVYLMFALERRDVWPPGDRALHVSMGNVFGLPAPPAADVATDMARRWRPWRSAAARLLWHDYLGGPSVVSA